AAGAGKSGDPSATTPDSASRSPCGQSSYATSFLTARSTGAQPAYDGRSGGGHRRGNLLEVLEPAAQVGQLPDQLLCGLGELQRMQLVAPPACFRAQLAVGDI